jgi:hypothetical protein
VSWFIAWLTSLALPRPVHLVDLAESMRKRFLALDCLLRRRHSIDIAA